MSILSATLGFFAALAFALYVIATTTRTCLPRIRAILAIELDGYDGYMEKQMRFTLRPLRRAVTPHPAPLRQARQIRAAA